MLAYVTQGVQTYHQEVMDILNSTGGCAIQERALAAWYLPPNYSDIACCQSNSQSPHKALLVMVFESGSCMLWHACTRPAKLHVRLRWLGLTAVLLLLVLSCC
jgi:hypothetical protein